MKANDPRILSVEEAGERVLVCIAEPDLDGPMAASLSGKEAEDFAIRMMAAGRAAQMREGERIEREEDEILNRARRIWMARHGGKPFLAEVS